MTFPLLILDEVWHVGDMDPASKRRGSYEGAGLSVSLHPYAWRTIARGLVSGSTWQLSRKGARFLDVLSLNDDHIGLMLAWGEAKDLLHPASIWRWSYWDDDLECEVHQDFGSREEALHESDDDASAIVELSGYRSTPSLDEITLQTRTTIGIRSLLDLIAPIYAVEEIGIEGAWWYENLDPVRLSAPRGVIPADQISLWKAVLKDGDPDQDEY